jgi:hypothetical protein
MRDQQRAMKVARVRMAILSFLFQLKVLIKYSTILISSGGEGTSIVPRRIGEVEHIR